jgi:transposase
MQNVRFVGMDVHKKSVVIAVAESDGSAPEVVVTLGNDDAAVLRWLRKLGAKAKLRCCYEAGPTGFGLCRMLRKAGIDCVVIAPSLVPKQHGDRVKTDSRDAKKLARFLRSGDLTEVAVPDAATEAMRDLERAREDAKNAERVARHQLSKFLLRHGRHFEGKTTWTAKHLDWIRGQKFEHEAHHRVLVDYIHAVEIQTARVAQLTKEIEELVTTWSLRPIVEALQTLRGVRLLSAVILAAEIGSFARFASAPALMSYLGLVPSEHSSGETKHRGRITRTGNGHARRILVEAAWAYRFSPRRSREIKRRNEGADPATSEVSWKAQQRLCARYRKMTARGKSKQTVITAIARELSGFVWSIGRTAEAKVAREETPPVTTPAARDRSQASRERASRPAPRTA